MSFLSPLKESARELLRLLRGQRDPRRRLLRRMPRGAVCAEIGVWKGDFSALIRETTEPETLHLIDPWEFQGEFPERMYGGSVARSQQDMDRIYADVRARFEGCSNVVFNRGRSETVLETFPDGYFDWVYIDGNHYYEYVSKDLELCLRKVKRGGLITGDDYTWGEKEGFPVRRAVHDFVAEGDLTRGLRVLGSQYIIAV